MVDQQSDFETLLARVMEQVGNKVAVRPLTVEEEQEGVVFCRAFQHNAQKYFFHPEKIFPIDTSQIVLRTPAEILFYPIESLYRNVKQGIESISAYLRK